jgi:hypothetical protein
VAEKANKLNQINEVFRAGGTRFIKELTKGRI